MILIAGATSENGSEIVRRLSAAKARVRAMVRSRSYEKEGGNPYVAYDRFSSLLPPYQPAEITPIVQLVEQKLEALVAEVTEGGGK